MTNQTTTANDHVHPQRSSFFTKIDVYPEQTIISKQVKDTYSAKKPGNKSIYVREFSRHANYLLENTPVEWKSSIIEFSPPNCRPADFFFKEENE